ncbi:MAG: hypothetical protein ABH824_01975 [Nanoarchaeota archaeon]|nr:hypothetical protein [Nanoarchaeota archaeon]MBU1632213.1 hypothetical protein [Nanoarchaeota archaeon]MBU1876374.1 hypothetical protein [Nanoarchaeota archaeon]
MNISKEAAYLYLYSKKLKKINKKIKKLSGKAEKHVKKHQQSTSEENRLKHSKRHYKVKEEIKDLLKMHNILIDRLKHHLVNFNDALRKEHKL